MFQELPAHAVPRDNDEEFLSNADIEQAARRCRTERWLAASIISAAIGGGLAAKCGGADALSAGRTAALYFAAAAFPAFARFEALGPDTSPWVTPWRRCWYQVTRFFRGQESAASHRAAQIAEAGEALEDALTERAGGNVKLRSSMAGLADTARRRDMDGHALADHVEALTGQIGATTALLSQGAHLASLVATTGFTAARAVTGIEAQLRPVEDGLASIDMLFARARDVMAREIADMAEAGDGKNVIDMAVRIGAMGRAGLAALNEIHESFLSIRKEAVQAQRSCQELCGAVEQQQILGNQLVAALLDQSEAIARLANGLDANQINVSMLRQEIAVASEHYRDCEGATNSIAAAAHELLGHIRQVDM